MHVVVQAPLRSSGKHVLLQMSVFCCRPREPRAEKRPSLGRDAEGGGIAAATSTSIKRPVGGPEPGSGPFNPWSEPTACGVGINFRWVVLFLLSQRTRLHDAARLRSSSLMPAADRSFEPGLLSPANWRWNPHRSQVTKHAAIWRSTALVRSCEPCICVCRPSGEDREIEDRRSPEQSRRALRSRNACQQGGAACPRAVRDSR